MKKNKSLRFAIEFWGWSFLVLLFVGIWIPKYRWRLISTSIVCIIIYFLDVLVLLRREKKYEKKTNQRRTKSM